MNVLLIIIAIVIHLFITTLPSFRAWFLYRKLNYCVKLRTLADILIIVAATNVVIPFRAGGLLIKTFVLKNRYGIPHKINLTIIAIEQLIDGVIQIFIVLLCIYLVGFDIKLSLTTKLIISLMMVSILALLFFWKGLSDFVCFIVGVIERIMPNRINSYIKRKTKISHFIQIISLIQNNNKSMIPGLIITTLIIYPTFHLSFYLFVMGVGLSLSFIQAFIVVWLSMFLGRISGIPGGYGVREASMIYLLTQMNIPLSEATTTTILFRVLSIGIIVVVGLLLGMKEGLNIYNIKRLHHKIQ